MSSSPPRTLHMQSAYNQQPARERLVFRLGRQCPMVSQTMSTIAIVLSCSAVAAQQKGNQGSAMPTAVSPDGHPNILWQQQLPLRLLLHCGEEELGQAVWLV